MLGRLARWLRILGLDTAYARGAGQAVFLSFLAGGRTGLSRRRSLRGRPGIVFIEPDRVEDQLAQAVVALGIERRDIRLFSRCLGCNLILEPVLRDEVLGRVPDFVWQTQQGFRVCPGCGRIFWPGTHPRRMEARLAPILDTLP